MRRIWVVARHEYVVNIRRTGFIVMTFLVPLLGLAALLIATFFGGATGAMLERQFSSEPKSLGVVDQAGGFTPILPQFADRFHAYRDEAAGRAAVEAGSVDTLLVIPPDYMATGNVSVISKGGAFNAAVMQDSTSVRAFFVSQLTQGKVSSQLQARLGQPVNPQFVALGGETGPTGTGGIVVNMLVPYFFGMLLIITIFTSSGYLLRSVSDEKASRVIEIVLSSVTARELLAGKVLGLGGVGLTQMIIWLTATLGLSQAAVSLLSVPMPLLGRPEIFVLAVVYYLLGYLLYAVVMAAAGALGTSNQESQQLAGIFSMFAAVPFMLVGFMFANPNVLIARILSYFPLTSPTMMLLRIPMSAQTPFVDVIGSLVVLVVSIPLFLWASAKVFRMGLLMYGKRPSLRQVWMTLRAA